MNDNIAFILTNYQNQLDTNTNTNTKPSLAVSKSHVSTLVDSKGYYLAEQDSKLFDDMTCGEIGMMTSMSYLHKLAYKPYLEVIIDPVSRFKIKHVDFSDQKLEIRSILKAGAAFEKSPTSENKENLINDTDLNKQSAALDLRNFSLAVTNIDNASPGKKSKKISIMVHQIPQPAKGNGARPVDVITEKTEPNLELKDFSDETEGSGNSDDELEDIEDLTAEKPVDFKELSGILFQFPDEVDPNDFFTQHNGVLGTFCEYLSNNSLTNPNLMLCSATNSQGTVFTSMAIELTDLMSKIYRIKVPFSLAYLLNSIPKIEQLCLLHGYVSNYIKTFKQFEEVINVPIFADTLNKLCGIEIARYSAISVKSHLRKSLFGNVNLNSIFGDNENSSGSRSQIIANFEEKMRNYSKNRTMSHAKSSQKTIQNSSLNVSNDNVSPNLMMQKISVSDQMDHGGENHQINKSIYSNFKDGVVDTEISSDRSGEEDSFEKTKTDKMDGDSDEQSADDSDNMSDSGDSCDSDSLVEEIYTSNNPYEIKYSKVTHKFKSYTISLMKPFVTDEHGGFVRNLEAGDLVHIFNSEFNHAINPFGNLVQ